MFYHRDTTKSELHDIFIDANYKADYCIEHIDLYGSIDFYNCFIRKARHIGVLQYACENPIIDQLMILDCKIGYYISRNEYNRLNPFDFSGITKGSPNIVNFKLLRVLGCNYGIILNGVSNGHLDSIETAYNSIIGVYIKDGTFEMPAYYSEGDGQCNFWINENGTKQNSESKEKTLPYLIDNDLDGFKPMIEDPTLSKDVFVRAPLYFVDCSINLSSSFISVHPRSLVPYNNTEVLDITDREYSGIDALLLISNCRLYGMNNTQYILSNNIGRKCRYEIISMCKTTYTSYPPINIGFNTAKANIRFIPINIENVTSFVNENKNNDFINFFEHSFKNLNGVNLYDNTPIQNKLNFVEYYNNIPLYQYKGPLLLSLTKEEFENKFADIAQIKILIIFRIKKTGFYRIEFKATYRLKNTIVYVENHNQHLDEKYEAGYYKYLILSDIRHDLDFDSIMYSLQNYVLDNPNLKDNILISDIYFYELADTKMQIPNVNPIRNTGTTAQRPTGVKEGYQYYDTTLKKYIVWNGTEWTNMDGTNLT